MAKTYLQEKLVSATNIKTINGQSLLGSGDIEVGGSTTTTYRLLFPIGSSTSIGESIAFSSTRPFIKLWIQGWMHEGNNDPYIFWIDYNNTALYWGRNNLGTTDKVYFNKIADNQFFVGIRNSDGNSRQIKITYLPEVSSLLVLPSGHNDVSYILEFC